MVVSQKIWVQMFHDWRQFPSRNIPSMYNYGHLYHYLVETIESITLSDSDNNNTNENTERLMGDTVTAKPLKKGFNLLGMGLWKTFKITLFPTERLRTSCSCAPLDEKTSSFIRNNSYVVQVVA